MAAFISFAWSSGDTDTDEPLEGMEGRFTALMGFFPMTPFSSDHLKTALIAPKRLYGRLGDFG